MRKQLRAEIMGKTCQMNGTKKDGEMSFSVKGPLCTVCTSAHLHVLDGCHMDVQERW